MWSFINFVYSFTLLGVVIFVFFCLLEQREAVERAPRFMERELELCFAVVTEPRRRLWILIWAWQALFLRFLPVIRMHYRGIMEQISDRTNRVVRACMVFVRVAEQLPLACSLVVLSKNVTQITRHESRTSFSFSAFDEIQCPERNIK